MASRAVPQNHCTRNFVTTELAKDGAGCTECFVAGWVQENARGPFVRSAFRSPLFPKIPEFGIPSSLSLSTSPCLILSRPMTSSSSEAMSPTPLGLLVARSQRSQGRGRGSHEGHYLIQRRRKNQRHLIKPRIRRIRSLVRNVAGKMPPHRDLAGWWLVGWQRFAEKEEVV